MEQRRFIATRAGWLAAALVCLSGALETPPLIASSPEGRAAAVAEAGAPAKARPPLSMLSGTSWQLVGIYVPAEGTTAPDDSSKYTIVFGADGRARIRADCNRGVASWHVGEDAALMFGRVRMTRVRCAPGSMHQRFVNDLAFVRWYELDAGRLRLDLRAQGGRLDFVRMTP